MKRIEAHVLFRLSRARTEREKNKTRLRRLSLAVAVAVLSCFLGFSVLLHSFRTAYPSLGFGGLDGESALTLASIKSFFLNILKNFDATALGVALLTFAQLLLQSRMDEGDERRFYACLATLGATRTQRMKVALLLSLHLYVLPVLLGVGVGLFPGYLLAFAVTRLFVPAYLPPASALLVPALALACLVLFALAVLALLPAFAGKRLLHTVKRAENREEEGLHGYRSSRTFREMPPEQRIAKKSTAYYKSAYRRIALLLVICLAYPLLAFAFFFGLIGLRVTDYNPSSGTDIAAHLSDFAFSAALVGLLALLLLTALALLLFVRAVRVQNTVRRRALYLYESVGMTKSGTRRLLAHEYKTVFFYAALFLIFAFVIFFSLL